MGYQGPPGLDGKKGERVSGFSFDLTFFSSIFSCDYSRDLKEI
jgi:hypothetical protein